MPASIPADPEAVHRTIREILDGGPYRFGRSGEAARPWAQKMLDLWVSFMEWMAELARHSPPLFWLVVAGLFAILGLLVWHIVYTLRRGARFGGSGDAAGEKPAVSPDLLLRGQAEAAALRGDYTEAARCLFKRLLLRYEFLHPGHPLRGSTNQEFLRRFAPQPALQLSLGEVVRLLDEKWYGQRACSADEFAAIRKHCEGLFEILR